MVAVGRHGRFGPLDGMRGVGALSIVIAHVCQFSSQVCGTQTCDVAFGYLAVDMFFILSGFVIIFSYDPRFAAGMTFRQFMIARVVRLYPIFFICALIGAIPFVWYALHGQGSRGRFLITFATNILMLPSPTYPVQPDPFPLVSPAWSLFFELFVANVSYALIWKYLTNRLLGLIIGVSLLALTAAIIKTGTVDGGSLWKTFPVGFLRVLYGFYTGVAVYRLFLRRTPPSVPSFVILTLIAVSFWPQLNGWHAPAYELLCIILVYPMLIYLGASAREQMPQLGSLLGEVSYALYLAHIPIFLLILAIVRLFGYTPSGPLPWVTLVGICLVFAFTLSFYYDRPARKFFAKLF